MIMKKILAMLLAATLLLGLCSCGKEKDDAKQPTNSTMQRSRLKNLFI